MNPAEESDQSNMDISREEEEENDENKEEIHSSLQPGSESSDIPSGYHGISCVSEVIFNPADERQSTELSSERPPEETATKRKCENGHSLSPYESPTKYAKRYRGESHSKLMKRKSPRRSPRKHTPEKQERAFELWRGTNVGILPDDNKVVDPSVDENLPPVEESDMLVDLPLQTTDCKSSLERSQRTGSMSSLRLTESTSSASLRKQTVVRKISQQFQFETTQDSSTTECSPVQSNPFYYFSGIRLHSTSSDSGIEKSVYSKSSGSDYKQTGTDSESDNKQVEATGRIFKHLTLIPLKTRSRMRSGHGRKSSSSTDISQYLSDDSMSANSPNRRKSRSSDDVFQQTFFFPEESSIGYTMGSMITDRGFESSSLASIKSGEGTSTSETPARSPGRKWYDRPFVVQPESDDSDVENNNI